MQRRCHKYQMVGRISHEKIIRRIHFYIMCITLDCVAAMPYFYPSNPSVVDIIWDNFQLIARKFPCLVIKGKRINILTDILAVGNFYQGWKN